MYVLHSPSVEREPLVLEFRDIFPRIPSSQTHAPFLQKIVHPSLPSVEGRCTGLAVLMDVRVACTWANYS